MKFNKKTFTKEIIDFYGQSLRRRITSEILEDLNTLLILIETDDKWENTGELAYFFATIGWETGWTFAPIEERRASNNQQDIRRIQDRYWNTGYFGRGYVQLTWRENYKKMGDILGVNLVNNPEELLKPKISYEVAAIGMRQGLFRTRSNGRPIKLSDFITDTSADFVRARDIINGDVEKNGPIIAKYAEDLHDIIKKSIVIEADVVSNPNNTKEPVKPNTKINNNPVTNTPVDNNSTTPINTSPWNPPIKIDPSNPVPTKGPSSLATTISSILSTIGLTGGGIWGYVSGIIPNIDPTVLFVGCLICIAVIVSVYLISRLYIKNARESRAAILDMQRVEITADPTKVNVECRLKNY